MPSIPTLEVMAENCDASETHTMDNLSPPLAQGDSIETYADDANQPTLSHKKDCANEGEDNNSSQGDYYEETRSSDQQGNNIPEVHTLDKGITQNEQVLQLIEKSNKQLSELVRRNEEKRGVIDELTDRIEKLESENRALQEHNHKLTEENLYLTMRSQKQNGGLSGALSFNGTRSKSLTRLKSLFMGTFGAETPTPSPLKE